jgi:hypothetical protein
MTTTRAVDKDRLVALISDPATTGLRWGSKALCRGRSRDQFFDDEAEHEPPCCAACPVRVECLATALAHERDDGHRNGWWGGTRPADREVIAEELGLRTRVDVEIDLRDPTARARYLRSDNVTIRAIADVLGCTRRTVYRYLAGDAA